MLTLNQWRALATAPQAEPGAVKVRQLDLSDLLDDYEAALVKVERLTMALERLLEATKGVEKAGAKA